MTGYTNTEPQSDVKDPVLCRHLFITSCIVFRLVGSNVELFSINKEDILSSGGYRAEFLAVSASYKTERGAGGGRRDRKWRVKIVEKDGDPSCLNLIYRLDEHLTNQHGFLMISRYIQTATDLQT